TLSGDLLFNPTGNVFFNAGRRINVDQSSVEVELDELTPYIKLAPDNTSSFFWSAGTGISIYELELGLGDFVASANNGMQIGRFHAGGKVLLRSVGQIDWNQNARAEEGHNPIDLLEIY